LHPPAGVKLASKNGQLVAEGAAPPQWIAEFEAHAPWIAGVTSIDDSRLDNSDLAVLKPLKTTIESVVVLFPVGSAQIETGQDDKLAQIGKDFQDLLTQAARLHESVTVEVTGHTDSTGIEGTNLPLSQDRADAVRSHFLRHGIKPANMRTVGVGTSQPLHSEDTEEGRQYNRSVTFRIAFTPLPVTASPGARSSALSGN
jgi:OOP family OmpA-OmpF porin